MWHILVDLHSYCYTVSHLWIHYNVSILMLEGIWIASRLGLYAAVTLLVVSFGNMLHICWDSAYEWKGGIIGYTHSALVNSFLVWLHHLTPLSALI